MTDMEHDPTGFEDEPLDIDQGQSFAFEGVDTALAKAERRRERRRRRNERTGKIAVAVFCVCLVIALILMFKVFKVTEKYVHDAFILETESPTISPPTDAPTRYKAPARSPVAKPTFNVITPAPTEKVTELPSATPTAAPSNTPSPTEALEPSYEMVPVEDTHLFIDGPNKARGYGRQDKLFVQHGSKLSTKPGQEPDIPTAYAFLKFELSTIEDFPDRSRWPEDMKVWLQLYHESQLDAAEDGREPSMLQVYRIPNNYNLEVESWTGTSFDSAPKETREGVLVADALVSADMASIPVDIKKAFYLPDDVMAAGSYEDDQILLMLAIDEGTTPRSGDEFRSRESSDPPFILFVMDED